MEPHRPIEAPATSVIADIKIVPAGSFNFSEALGPDKPSATKQSSPQVMVPISTGAIATGLAYYYDA